MYDTRAISPGNEKCQGSCGAVWLSFYNDNKKSFQAQSIISACGLKKVLRYLTNSNRFTLVIVVVYKHAISG